jgi:transposase-like protein
MIPQFSNILELVTRFPDERSCHQYLASRRWNGYMQCPHDGCDGDEAYVFSDGIRYKCKCCKKQYTARTGTILEASKLPIRKWFVAIYMIMHKKGISSIQLGKDLGVTQKTAWFLLHRIRAIFNNLPEVILDGVVELDETYVGGKNKNRHFDKKVKNSAGRACVDKTAVFGMLQRGGTLKAMVVRTVTAKELCTNVWHSVKRGCTLMTDEYNAYNPLSPYYDHQKVVHGRGQYVQGECYTNGLENFWSHLKRGIIGVYHWTSRKHLNKYVQEFVFKYNYRNMPIQTQMNVIFDNSNCRLTYKQLTSNGNHYKETA